MTTGTNTGSATGTVTGFRGQALTGTMDWTGTTPTGSTITRTGTVTILPTGELIYNWTDTVTGTGSVLQATGTGTSAQTPGTYFTQTVSGQETTTTNLAGNQATTTNSGDLTGTRVMNGISSDIKAGFSVTSTAPNAGTFIPKEATDVVVSSAGVLGAPDANGVRLGVMTSTATTATDTTKNGGPVRDVPAASDGSSPAATFKQVIGNSPAGGTTLGISAQTTNLSAAIITSTYEGSGTMASSPPYTTGTFSSTGWGIGSASMGGSSETAPYTGSMTATVTQTGSGTFNPGPEVIQYTGAAVVLPDPSYTSFQGPAQGVGISAPHTVISITGTGTGNLSTGVGTTSFNGTWVSPDSKGTLTNGTLTVTPGEYFQQTTNAGAGTVTLNAVQGSGPYTQASDLSATMTRITVPPTTPVNQVLSGTITSTTNAAGAFPAPTIPPTPPRARHYQYPGGGGPGGDGPERQYDHDHASSPGGAGEHLYGPGNYQYNH